MSYYLSYFYWFAKVEGDGRVSLPIGGAHGLEVAVNAHVWSLVQVLFLPHTGHWYRDRHKCLPMGACWLACTKTIVFIEMDIVQGVYSIVLPNCTPLGEKKFKREIKHDLSKTTAIPKARSPKVRSPIRAPSILVDPGRLTRSLLKRAKWRVSHTGVSVCGPLWPLFVHLFAHLWVRRPHFSCLSFNPSPLMQAAERKILHSTPMPSPILFLKKKKRIIYHH